jgi:SHS2 domain-containing protein
MKYKYLEHTADAMFEAYGKCIEEAFANSAEAMFNLLTDISEVKQIKKKEFSVNADSYEKLLFDFLSELLFYLDTEFLLFCKFEISIKKIKKEYMLSCKAYGDKATKYDTKGDIKSVTYNEMSISEDENGFKIRFVVDI